MDDTKKAADLAIKLAAVVEGYDPIDIFDACTAVLAVSDVINGTPQATLRMGSEKIQGELIYASEVVKEYINSKRMLPTMAYVLGVRQDEIALGNLREARLKLLN